MRFAPGLLVAIGDDVVDLGDPAIATSHLRERFVRRVLTTLERARLEGPVDAKALLWAHFALKEAAYKAVAQLRPPPGFAYRRFEVSADLSSVSFEELVLHARVDVSARRVHAIAWLGAEPALAGVRELESGADASAAARSALCEEVARHLGCDADQLAVVRERIAGTWDGFGPPRLEREGRVLPHPVSLSHDGRYFSFAFRGPPQGAARFP